MDLRRVFFRSNKNRDGTDLGSHYGGSEIVRVVPGSDGHDVLYGGTPDQLLHTGIRGKKQVLPIDQNLITEHDAGRILEVDVAGGRVVWEFVNRYGPDEVAELTEARADRKSVV